MSGRRALDAGVPRCESDSMETEGPDDLTERKERYVYMSYLLGRALTENGGSPTPEAVQTVLELRAQMRAALGLTIEQTSN